MSSPLARALIGLSCLATGVLGAAVGSIHARDASNEPRYDPLDGTVENCQWWWNSDDGLNCKLVLSAVGVSEKDFIAWNPSITSGCGNWQISQSYCIKVAPVVKPPTTTSKPPSSTTQPPTTTSAAPPANGVETPSPIQEGMVENCDKFHFVEAKQNCGTITKEYGISMDDFTTWNPEVGGAACDGLWAEVYVCVSVIGFTPAPPTITKPPNGIETPSPIQEDMVDNCNEFYKVVKGDNCAKIASNSKIPLDKFYEWNPAVSDDCSGLWLDTYVCISTTTFEGTPTQPGNGIETPTPIQDDMVSNCNKFHFVKKGNTCANIAKDANVPLTEFYKWNPAVGKDCESLWLDVYVCTGTTTFTPTPTDPGNGVSTPSPIQDGMTKNCKTFHKVVSGDNCDKIAKKYNISLSNFNKWNPAAGSDCSGLWLNTYACVAVL